MGENVSDISSNELSGPEEGEVESEVEEQASGPPRKVLLDTPSNFHVPFTPPKQSKPQKSLKKSKNGENTKSAKGEKTSLKEVKENIGVEFSNYDRTCPLPSCHFSSNSSLEFLKHLREHMDNIKTHISDLKFMCWKSSNSKLPAQCKYCHQPLETHVTGVPLNSLPLSFPQGTIYESLDAHQKQCVAKLQVEIDKVYFPDRDMDLPNKHNSGCDNQQVPDENIKFSSSSSSVEPARADNKSQLPKSNSSTANVIKCSSSDITAPGTSGETKGVEDSSQKLETLKNLRDKIVDEDKEAAGRETLLDHVDYLEWSSCPVCYKEVQREKWILHCFNCSYSVQEFFYKIFDGDTPEEDSYTCPGPCGLQFEKNKRYLHLMHKYMNCKVSAEQNLRKVLSKVKMENFLAELQEDLELRMIAHYKEMSQRDRDQKNASLQPEDEEQVDFELTEQCGVNKQIMKRLNLRKTNDQEKEVSSTSVDQAAAAVDKESSAATSPTSGPEPGDAATSATGGEVTTLTTLAVTPSVSSPVTSIPAATGDQNQQVCNSIMKLNTSPGTSGAPTANDILTNLNSQSTAMQPSSIVNYQQSSGIFESSSPEYYSSSNENENFAQDQDTDAANTRRSSDHASSSDTDAADNAVSKGGSGVHLPPSDTSSSVTQMDAPQLGTPARRLQRKKTTAAASIEDVDIRDSVEENLRVMGQTLTCFQCWRVFKHAADVTDARSQKHHYCATIGNLRHPLKIDGQPTPSKLSSLKCVICPGNKLVFCDQTEMMKHICLAHKANFFKTEIEKQSNTKEFNGNCVKGCAHVSEDLEDAILHLGIHHEQLFWALKHDKKYKEHPELDWGHRDTPEDKKKRNVSGTSDTGVKRRLSMGESTDSEAATADSADTPSLDTAHSGSEDVPPPVKKRRRMQRQQCPLCAEVLSNKTLCNLHLVKNHFLRRLTTQFPLVGAVRDRVTFPCTVDGCTELRMSAVSRLLHIATEHGVLRTYLDTGVPEDDGAVAAEVETVICDYCHEELPRPEYYRHPCCQMFVEPNNNKDQRKVAETSKDGQIQSIVEDMREDFVEMCSESGGEEAGVGGSAKEPPSLYSSCGEYECEARGCDRTFATPHEQIKHQVSAHDWADF